MTAVLKRH